MQFLAVPAYGVQSISPLLGAQRRLSWIAGQSSDCGQLRMLSLNIDRLFPSFHYFLMRHGKMHGFRHIAFDDTMVYSAIDAEGKRNMSELLIPLNYHMIPNNYAIKPIE